MTSCMGCYTLIDGLNGSIAHTGTPRALAMAMLHCCYGYVTLLLWLCYTVAMAVLHCCYGCVTLLLWLCYTVAMAMSALGYSGQSMRFIAMYSHGCYPAIATSYS